MKGENASRYSATSSSLVKTQSLPTAWVNLSSAAEKSPWLIPGGVFIASNAPPRSYDPRIQGLIGLIGRAHVMLVPLDYAHAVIPRQAFQAEEWGVSRQSRDRHGSLLP